jgi:hypothetical protein
MNPRTILMLSLVSLFTLVGCDGGSDHAHDADGNHIDEGSARSGDTHGDHEHVGAGDDHAHDQPETEAYYGEEADDAEDHHDDRDGEHGHDHENDDAPPVH